MPFIYARWVIAASLACTTLVSLAQSQDSQSQDAQPASSVLDAQTRNTQEPSKRLLHRMYGAQRPFEDKSPAEIAKLLNYAVFNHCSIDLPHTGRQDITELFDVCRTSCGGYSYVLRGLLGAYGIRTRYANLYNLPKQGNHTMVEAEVEPGVWALYDPTFGAYFSKRLGDKPLSLEEVRFMLTPETIKKYVNTAAKEGAPARDAKVGDLYAKSRFNYPNMDLDSYVTAEAGVPVGQNVKVPLVMPLRMSGTKVVAGKIGAQSLEEGRAAFLQWTRDTLNSEGRHDDVSYLFHIVGSYKPYYRSANIVRLTKLKKGKIYRIAFSGLAPADAELQIVDIGRDIKLNSILAETLPPGPYTTERRFRAINERADIYVSLSPSVAKTIYLFGVSVSEE